MTRSNGSIDSMEMNIEDNFSKDDDFGRRPYKRNRGLDQEEVWTTVGRKGKRFARSIDVDDSTRVREDFMEICISSTDKLPKQFMLAKTLKSENIQDIIKVKYLNPYKVILHFSKEDSAEKLLNSKCFNENGRKCHKTFEINQPFGVIKNIDLGLSEEEIGEALTCDFNIIAVKRLKRRNSLNGQWEPGESVRIGFKGSSLPSYIYIFDTRISVSPYVYPVTQCSHCWRYGHSLKMCPSNRAVCPKCGDHHTNCEKTSYTCNNCGGNHMALAKTCPIYIKEKRIRELMAEFNCSYKKALTIYTPPSPPIYQPKDFPELTQNVKDKEEETIVEDTNKIRPNLSSYAAVTIKQSDKRICKKVKNKITSNSSTD
ncbi:hypothetical protein O3G_MSEX012336 [Manduca sexta]|uniref:Gag-like protein n=1 Tax=Manduca sexta TaxID=7130 RepID=A0A921ZNX0_MANSE|nr:hypothetical protein O3G_MSEX012336 [Manduca sexta]